MDAHRLFFYSLVSPVLSMTSAIAHASPASFHFDIPAGDAQKTLIQFVAQANIEALYSSQDVRGVVTRPVVGNYTVAEALSMMTDGSGLVISFERDYTFASITAAGGREGEAETHSPTSDEIRSSQSREWDLSSGTAVPAMAQVVVTGTLLHGVSEVVAPVQVLKKDDARVNYGSVSEMTQMLPLSSRAGPNESYLSAGNFTRGTSANLRGLGTGATLVLVNGRRQAMAGVDGDFVDLSGIPWAAVDRIEVLPDGASALYGSDAVAGVVNVIMRSSGPKGSETTGRLGLTSDGASERLASQVSSWKWSSGHALAAYQYSQRATLAASERDYAASSDKRPLGGSDFRSIRASPGNVLNPITFVPAYAIPSGSAHSVTDLIPNSLNLEDRNALLDLLPFRQDHSAFISAAQEIGDMEFFVEGRVNRRRLHVRNYAQEQDLLVPASNPYALNPFPERPLIVAYSFVDTLGPIALNTTSLGASATAGVRKILADWHLDLSVTHGTETADVTLLNQPDQNHLRMALADTQSSAFNPFGATNPQTIDFIRLDQRATSKSALSDATFVADGKLWSSTKVEGRLAIGAALRQERLERTYPGLGSFSRSVRSFFAEVRVPLAPSVSSSESYPRLELSAAGRLEDYSGFGSSANPRFAMKWAPTSELRVRTSWGTSFKAPKLVDMYDVNANNAGLAVLADPQSKAGVSPVLYRQGANGDLHEETATTWTVGLDLAPKALPVRASLTYFNVAYRGRIVRPGPLSVLDILRDEAQWTSVITRNPTRAQMDAICDDPSYRGDRVQCLSTTVAAILDLRQQNLLTTTATGFDFNADAAATTNIGAFTANVRAAYTLKFSQRGSDSSPSTSILDTIGNPLAFKARASAEWRQRLNDGWIGSLGVEYNGAYRDVGNGRQVGSFRSFDASIGYMTGPAREPLSNLSFEFAVSNVLDAAPPFVDREAGYDIGNVAPYGRITTLIARKRW